ncbi:hypothetical protein Efla_000146 [Eimeria flavescens]
MRLHARRSTPKLHQPLRPSRALSESAAPGRARSLPEWRALAPSCTRTPCTLSCPGPTTTGSPEPTDCCIPRRRARYPVRRHPAARREDCEGLFPGALGTPGAASVSDGGLFAGLRLAPLPQLLAHWVSSFAHAALGLRVQEQLSAGLTAVDYFGESPAHLRQLTDSISRDSIRGCPSEIPAAVDRPVPANAKPVQSFPRKCQDHCKFIQNFPSVAAAFSQAISVKHAYKWSGPCDLAWRRLRDALSSEPVLAQPHYAGASSTSTVPALGTAWAPCSSSPTKTASASSPTPRAPCWTGARGEVDGY